MKSAFSDAAANVPGKPKMWDRLSFVIKHFREQLWIKPLIVCVLSISAVFLANLIELNAFDRFLPEITKDSTETLLKIMASSMLMMATFAVASMVAAYASASRSATPRSFPLIIADDVSQKIRGRRGRGQIPLSGKRKKNNDLNKPPKWDTRHEDWCWPAGLVRGAHPLALSLPPQTPSKDLLASM